MFTLNCIKYYNMEKKLIIAVNDFPILYDKSLMCYWELNKKNDAWKHIIREMHHFSKRENCLTGAEYVSCTHPQVSGS